jgi:hypothetical protein
VYQQHQSNLARNDINVSSKNSQEPSNNDIINGAAILRRQLSKVTRGGFAATGSTSSSSSSSGMMHQNYEAQTPIERDERSDWDPWRIPQTSSILSQENRQQVDGGVVPPNKMPYVQSLSAQQHSSRLNSTSRDGGQTVQDNNDDDTVNMLERAKSFYQSMTFSGIAVKHDAQHNKKPYVQTAKNDKENKGKNLVEQVTDMDNSTFSSGGGGGTYLPTHLFSAGSSSPPVAASSKSSYIQKSSTNVSAVSPTKPIDPPVSKSNDFFQVIDDNEGFETASLDFLANLHATDDDQSAVRHFFEDDGKSSTTGVDSPAPIVNKKKQVPAPVVRDQKPAKSQVPAVFREFKSPTSSNAGRTNHIETRVIVDKDQKSTVSSLSWSHGGNLPRITQAAAPFQNMIAPCSYMYDELLRDPAYQHAIRAGQLWQSLCSQHVRMPSLWWDGKEPGAPPFGTPEKNRWTYLGRHRVKDDRKLNTLIGNRGSSGRLLLHIVVRDIVTLEPIEDICCGCFHPNARGVRTTQMYDPRLEDCRDVWIGHRRRGKASKSSSTIESVLKHQNKGRVDRSPLGGELAKKNKQGGIDNGNLNAVFGDRPPVTTVMVMESDLFELFQSELDGTNPASIVLLRRYLKQRVGH